MTAQPLFLTRKFPPSIGGMETLAGGVWRSLSATRPGTRLIALGRSNRNLVWWTPWAVTRLAWLLARRRIDLVLTGDALMYAIARPVLRLFRVRNATMIMGLDVTYSNRLYRGIVLPALRKAPAVIAISAATAARAVEVGVPPDRVTVVRLGVGAPDVTAEDRATARVAMCARLGVDENATVLLTVGRLVRRKGAQWLISQVLPRLPESVHFVVAGDGPESDAIRGAVDSNAVTAQVHLLGRVDDEVREELMRGADLFVQPNVVVPGDMEGFGLVTIEAAMRGTPVVASDLEGIKDAVVDGQTGILLPTGDADTWVETLVELTADRGALGSLGARFGKEALARYGEAAMGKSLCETLKIEPDHVT